MRICIIDNARLYSLWTWKVSSPNIRRSFLEEYKYAQEKVKTKNYIDEELKSESDTDSDSDTDTDNEE